MADLVNPFILPTLAEDEVTYTDSRLKTAASLAAHYIAGPIQRCAMSMTVTLSGNS